MLEAVAGHPVIAAVEDRIAQQLEALSAGVSRQWPYVRGQVVDDAYLARVLELMLAVIEGRRNARPLEVSGLGYVNLLHIAVTLAAIPDATRIPQSDEADESERVPEHGPSSSDPDAEGLGEEGASTDARDIIDQATAERDSEEDSFFGVEPFHATVVVEEPEAHLHPQLQHSLVRHLRRAVSERPELQVILSSHATDVITSCEPEEIVVFRRSADGGAVARNIATLPMQDRPRVLRMARLHLDANRSSSLFSDRLVLVEGVTEAAVLRQFGWIWAGADRTKQAFVDALSIIPMGTKVGSWAVRLLATRDYELVSRLAVLRDTDLAFDEEVPEPSWMAAHDSAVVRMFHSHPTLEPALTPGNESLISEALTDIGLDLPDEITQETIRDVFRSRTAPRDGAPGDPAGAGAAHKGDFALALAARLEEARQHSRDVSVPTYLVHLYDFLYPPPAPPL
jgi:putative ATP-dependent endonuclease of OLD family